MPKRKLRNRTVMESKGREAYEHISTELDKYLSTVPISEDDPALLFVWDVNALIEFVKHVKAYRPNPKIPAPPAWLATTPPNVTDVTLMNDIMSHLALHAGGRCENVMLAPNTLNQYGNVRDALTRIEVDPFIQHYMDQLRAGVFLAHTYVITDRAVMRAIPAQRAGPDAPRRQVFE